MNGCARALEARLELERREDLLDRALRAVETALDDSAEMPRLVRQRVAGRQVHVRDLEQGDVVGAGVDVVACGSDEPVEQRRAEDALQLRERLRQHERVRVRVVGLQRVRVRLEEAAADEDVGDPAPETLLARQPAEQLLPHRQRRRHFLEPEARNLLDEVDLATHVARAPVRRADGPVLVDVEPEPLEAHSLVVLGDRDADDLVRALLDAG